MRLDIHHYYHLSPEEKQFIQAIKEGLLPVERKLEQILEELKFMATQEAQLNEEIAFVKEAVISGFERVNETVDRAAQRVIQRLEAHNIDLSDEIEILKGLKTNVRQAVDSVKANIDQIAPDVPVETPPVGEVELTETEVEPEASGNQSPSNELTDTDVVQSSDGGSNTVTNFDEADTQEFPEVPADSAPADNAVVENNQPFEPAGEAENTSTSGFDDQERTPVPQI